MNKIEQTRKEHSKNKDKFSIGYQGEPSIGNDNKIIGINQLKEKQHSQQTKSQSDGSRSPSTIGARCSEDKTADINSPRKIEPKQPIRSGKVVEDTIQSKRKELENKVYTQNGCNFIDIAQSKLEGFNLGVSLAQKEIHSSNLTSDYQDGYIKGKQDAQKEFLYIICYNCFGKFYINKNSKKLYECMKMRLSLRCPFCNHVAMKIAELQQSLEVKK